MGDVKLEARGIRELASAFRSVDAELGKKLKAGFLQIAENVAGKVRERVPHGESNKAAGSVRARARQSGASIAFGGSAAPYYPWLDFGGSVGRGHKERVPWSGAIKRDWKGKPSGDGRYVYPTISEARPETEEMVDRMIAEVARANGFETHKG